MFEYAHWFYPTDTFFFVFVIFHQHARGQVEHSGKAGGPAVF